MRYATGSGDSVRYRTVQIKAGGNEFRRLIDYADDQFTLHSFAEALPSADPGERFSLRGPDDEFTLQGMEE